MSLYWSKHLKPVWSLSFKNSLLLINSPSRPAAEWPSGRPGGRPANELKRTSLQTALRIRVKLISVKFKHFVCVVDMWAVEGMGWASCGPVQSELSRWIFVSHSAPALDWLWSNPPPKTWISTSSWFQGGLSKIPCLLLTLPRQPQRVKG